MDIPQAWIEAGARALAHNDGVADADVAYMKMAKLCLAAVFGKATLVRTNEFDDCNLTYAEVDCDWDVREGSEVELEPRATLVIVRGW